MTEETNIWHKIKLFSKIILSSILISIAFYLFAASYHPNLRHGGIGYFSPSELGAGVFLFLIGILTLIKNARQYLRKI